jgi:hypothetical protein
LWEYTEGSRSLQGGTQARKVFGVVEHPDQNDMGTPLGEKAEAKLALTLHYGQRETRDGEVREKRSVLAHQSINLGGGQAGTEKCLALGDLGCNRTDETVRRGGSREKKWGEWMEERIER